MTIAFVLGNGVSRQAVDLNQLKPHGKIYGCNALHRDFIPDVLVATDRLIAASIQESGYALTHIFYTRKPFLESGALQVPKEYYGFSSGPIAASLAALNNHSTVYMVGFDMGPDQNNKFNNIYAGTEFYKPFDALPTYTGNWVKQIVRIAQDFPKSKFIRVQGKTTAHINEFERVRNIQHLPMSTFVDRINKQKDL